MARSGSAPAAVGRSRGAKTSKPCPASGSSRSPSHIFPGFRIWLGSNACLTRFINAIISGDSSSPRYGAFANPMPCSPLIDPSRATTPWNSSRSAAAARRISSAFGRIDHQVDVNVAVAGMAEAGNQQPVLVAHAIDEVEQLRHAAARDHDVVVDLARRQRPQRERQLATRLPDRVAILGGAARCTPIAPAR